MLSASACRHPLALVAYQLIDLSENIHKPGIIWLEIFALFVKPNGQGRRAYVVYTKDDLSYLWCNETDERCKLCELIFQQNYYWRSSLLCTHHSAERASVKTRKM